MRLVSPFLKHVLYPALHYTGVLRRTAPVGSYSVVNYHGVFPANYSSRDAFLDANLVQPAVFRRHLQFLKTHYNVIHPEGFLASIEQGKQLPPRAVLVTCDDGLLNTFTDMLPVLQSEGVACLFFVTAASCRDRPGMLWYEELYHLMRAQPRLAKDSQLPVEEGAGPHSSPNFQALWWSTVRRASQLDTTARANWMAQLRHRSGTAESFQPGPDSEPSLEPSSERRWRLLSISELKQLAEAGMTIGAHTSTHPVLSLCSGDEARREIQASKIDLERALGRRVWAFAYPFGNPATMGTRELRLAREAGFACAFLNVEDWDADGDDRFIIPRTHVSFDTTLPELAAHVSGLHLRLQRAGAL